MSTSVYKILLGFINLSLVLGACGGEFTLTPTASSQTTSPAEPAPSTQAAEATPAPQATETSPSNGYRNPSSPIEQRVADLLAKMTLAEKIGQMTQVEKDSLNPKDVTQYFIGSVLSGGGGSPSGDNTALGWAKMTGQFQSGALATRLAIPLLYGVDAVHGHGNLRGATVFPQNIGLGAANDPALMYQIGQATALEMRATGIPWNFAPVVAVPQDIRWGRTYEGYSENTARVSALAAPYIQGLQTRPDGASGLYTLATPKHFIGDGGTLFGTSTTNHYLLDQGDMQVDEATLRALFLPPYQAAIEAGAQSIMVSFSSWNGVKMHAQKYLLSDVLKGELGFKGFVVSDWQAIDQIPGDYYNDVVTSINAGVDMVMVPYDYKAFITNLTQAVEKGDVPLSRVEDAVARILRVKFQLGLFEEPYADPALLSAVASPEHRDLARQAVRESLVLLRNAGQTLPLAQDTPLILVAGQAADDIGIQSGGWTITWQGQPGAITTGTTILQGIQAAVGTQAEVRYDAQARFNDITGTAPVGILVIGEKPYSEGEGDRADLSLDPADRRLIEALRAKVDRLVVILISGRPLILSNELPQMDALVAAWQPGTEGQGIADVLFGETPFSGTLPYTWPRSSAQLPLDAAWADATGCAGPLFPYGFGLKTTDASPEILSCP